EVLSHDTASTMKGAQVFATWLADYEDWILACQGADYRSQCRHMLGRLPKGSPWLPAPQATKWLRALAQQGAAAPRAKNMFHGTSGHNPSHHASQQTIRPSRLRQEKSHAALN
ncbi:MAG: hypothetical protein WAW39_11815, partial [Prosthecobacter sp.]|uniref:hypothetical protein n=1 Tax=Prosthecobacter sp. TaxID=1965333 RepID=UPI003BB01BB3